MFKKVSAVLAIVGFAFVVTTSALACEGPECSELWVNGDINLNQWGNVDFSPATIGGVLTNGAGQGLDMWAGIGGYGDATGTIDVIGSQTGALQMTQPIVGGEMTVKHQLLQEGALSLEGKYASGWGNSNNLLSGAVVAGGAPTDGGFNMFSANENTVLSDGKLCVFNGTGALNSEVLNQNSHNQALTFTGGSGMTTSYTGVHTTLQLSVTD